MRSKIWLTASLMTFMFMIYFSSCKKDDTNNNNPPANTVKDFDGNIYHTIKIGTQVWMVENLKVTHYLNGDPIALIKLADQWRSYGNGAFCYYDNDTTNVATYGLLYNWYAAINTKGIAPVGWHLPSNAEWQTLHDFLTDVGKPGGGKMKETDTIHLKSPNTGATNETGFTGLPGGGRQSGGSFQFIGIYGQWWTATEDNTSLAFYWFLSNNNVNISNASYNKFEGHSIRCIKN